MSNMDEEISYHDGDIVWIKMNKIWWPGEVHESHRLPSDFFDQFKKPPLVVVKFFQEQNYHYVNQLNQIARFNCPKKKEFIKKGLDLCYAKHSYMEDFPGDVAIAEKRTGGNPNIIYSKEFVPVEKPDKTTPVSASKGSSSRSRRGQQIQPSNKSSIPRVMVKPDHGTRILVSSDTATSTSTIPTAADNRYKCTLCDFSTTRINIFVWHQKSHSSTKTSQPSTSQNYFAKQTFTPSTSTVAVDELKSTTMQSEDEKNFSEDDKTIDSANKIHETIDIVAALPDSPEKSKGKRLRHTNESISQFVDEASKTDNKLKKILDDWSDEEILDTGPSESTNTNYASNAVDDGEMEQEVSMKKKLKFSKGSTRNGSNGMEKNESNVVLDAVAVCSRTSVDEDKFENKSKLGKRQSEQSQTADTTTAEVQPQTRFHLRSGRAAVANENSVFTTTKRRGRAAKRSATDALKTEITSEEIKESEIESVLPNKIEAIDASSGEQISKESIAPAPVQIKSNSKTSRKGKPRRKEEIKLANNVSVAVLVEKTNLSPRTDKESERKVDVPADDNEYTEYTNIVHKKIRYMSRGSTDDFQKSIESIKEPKLLVTDKGSNNHSGDQLTVGSGNCEKIDTNVDKKAEHVLEMSSTATTNLDATSDFERTQLEEQIYENLTVFEAPSEQRFTQKCYKRKSTPRESDVSTTSSTSLDMSIDKYELPSSSNLRQRVQRRYENTRNRKKIDRRTTSDDDFSKIVREIDDNCEKNDRMRQKSVELLGNLNDGGRELDQSSENSNSKTSTPEKADNSKELDCFDFTEDECPPQVLNRRKRLPPVKVFELEDIEKIEERRKIDEEAARLAQKRDEENDKLHADLENFLNSTTPVAVPQIPTGHKVHENFPERRAEKDPEKNVTKESDVKDRMLPPKERNKRIFKYRNRNRRSDSDTKVVSDDNSGSISSKQPPHCEENMVMGETETIEQKPSNHQESETDKDKAHDLKIEIAETLINFPLLSPQVDGKEPNLLVGNISTKTKASVKSAKTTKKLRNDATVASIPQTSVAREEITLREPNESQRESTDSLIQNNEPNCQSSVTLIQPEASASVTSTNPTPGDSLAVNTNVDKSNDNPSLQRSIEKCEETETETTQPDTSNSVRDFSSIRFIEKIDSYTSIQANDDLTKTHPLPLKKAVVLTQTESKNFITRIPKKRKSQMDDDLPAFVIERPKIYSDSVFESNQHMVVNREPKSFTITKTVQKQVTGELPKTNTLIASGVIQQNPNELNEYTNSNDSQQERSYTYPAGEISAIESSVIVSNHLINQKGSSIKNAQKRTPSTSTVANVLSNLSANRPCTIALAEKASYRRPADMTGISQKQIGIDGKGNPVIAYSKITPIATQTPPVQSQVSTFPMKGNEPIPSSSQTFTTSLQSNQGNQFVITSKGTLIRNKPFITTTHATQLNQPTLTNRQNIQVHTQLIRSPNTQFFQTQQQQHLPSQPNQIIIQTTPINLLSQIPSIAPAKKHPTSRRNVVNKTKVTEALEQSNDGTTNSFANDEGNATFKKRIVRRISKNQSSAIQQQQQKHSEINHISNAVPPLIPINETRKQQTMTFIQEPQIQSKAATNVEIVEQQQQEILALPGDTPGFGGPRGSYFLCKLNEMGVYIPIDHQPLYLDVTDNTNLLKPNAPEEIVTEMKTIEMNELEIPQQSPFGMNNEAERLVVANQTMMSDPDANNPKYLINISDGQQLLVDQQSLMALANGEEFPQFVTPDGQQIILQSGQHDILSAIAFAEDVGLIAGQQILIPEEDLAVIQGQGGNHDILAAALAGTEGFNQEQYIDNVLIQSANGVEEIVDPMVFHTMPQTSVTNAVTNETNAVLTQPPIMSTLEQPTKTDRIPPNNSLELIGQNLDESLAVIGVTSNTNVPTSLELPITITNPAIAPKTTSMSAIYPTAITNEHELDYDIFSSSLPITHHVTQSINVINAVGGMDLDSNSAASNVHQFIDRN